jgi:hypothetical protein
VNFIDKEFPESREVSIASVAQNIILSDPVCGRLMGLVELVASIPEHLMPADPDGFNSIILSVAMIRTAVTKFERLDHKSIYGPGVTLAGITSRGSWNPVTIIRRALEGLPDAVPSPATSDFPFISEQRLREALRLDLSEVNEAIRNRNYKSATVLAGSLVEALLLWAIEQRPPADIATAVTALKAQGKILQKVLLKPEDWHLHE